MKWASAISENQGLEAALDEAVLSIRRDLEGKKPDLTVIFVSSAFSDRYQEAPSLLADRLPSRVLIGCGAGGLIGGARELEQRPGVSLTAALLPDVELRPFHVQDEGLPDLDASPRAWRDMAGVKDGEDPHFILLADPFSLRADHLVMGLDYAFPKSSKVGGLASGASEPGGNAIYLDNLCLRSGAAGLALLGNARLDVVVSQGCKPVGPSYRVTECRHNILVSLDGKPALQVLQELAQKLPPGDQALLSSALFLGLAMTPANAKPGMGDFLVRNIVGMDPRSGRIAVGALLRQGQTVRFHLRDGRAAAEDLDHALARAARRKEKPSGALLFSCLGRGRGLFGEPDHDSRLFQRKLGPAPLGGLFCNGEIGPVAGTTYLHGYTSCFGLFSPRNGEA